MCLQQDFKTLAQFGVASAFAFEKCLSGLRIGQVQQGDKQFLDAAGIGGHERFLPVLSLISANRDRKVSRIRGIFVAGQRGGQDGTNIRPVTERRGPGNAERLSRFLNRQSGEQPQAGDLRR